MKIKNIFKKSTKVVAKANIQKLEKTQLEKVAGGVEIRTAHATEEIIIIAESI